MLIGAVTLFVVVTVLSGVTLTSAAMQPTQKPLPPTWTPEPTLTPFPTQPIPTFDSGFPTSTPIATFKPFVAEQAQLAAPVFYLSRRRSPTTYIARAQPGVPDATRVTETTENILSFDIATDGRLAYSTESGLVFAAGHAKPWKSTVKTSEPMRAYDLSWSPDGKLLAFGLRASEKDFAQMSRTVSSGVYLWAGKGDPKQIIVDKPGNDRVNYSAAEWSPDDRNLLIRFTEPQGYGWDVYNLATSKSTRLARFTQGDAIQYQAAIWTPDSSQILLFNRRTDDPDAPGGAALVDLSSTQRPLVINGKDAPKVTSEYRFLPDNRLLVLGSTSRADPLQLYVGTFDGTQASLQPLGKAFRLKWPGVLFTSATGFPAYVLDQQYGVIVYNSGNTLAYDPAQLGLSATDTVVYDTAAFPAWRFGPDKVTLPGK